MAEETVYSVPQFIKDRIRSQGYDLATGMDGYISTWLDMFKASGSFWDYSESDASGRVYRVHRRTVRPAKRVSEEWASLLLNDDTQVVCEEQACTDWLADYYRRVNFYGLGQEAIAKAFALGTGAWAVWLDLSAGKMQVRRYDARMVLPLSWDDDGVTECAFATRARIGGRDYDQLQMHVAGDGGYHIVTACFDEHGNEVAVDGVIADLATGCPTPTFAVIRPAISNTCVDNSPYGQSVYDDAVDALKSVDEAYDAIFNEVRLSKMRVFMDDMMFEVTSENGKDRQAVPFGRDDAVVFRKVSAAGDGVTSAIKEFAPALRTEAQVRAYRTALQTMGDKCGFGLNYFDIDDAGGVKTATEVSSDNSALMRNIRRHENLLEGALAQISRAVLWCANAFLGAGLPDPGEIAVNWDDSIITDTYAEKQQDLAEVNVTMNPWEYRMKWYGEDEETAKANAPRGYSEQPFDDEGEFAPDDDGAEQ